MENPALNSSTEDDVVDSERFIDDDDDDDDDDSSSVDSNYEIDLPTILQSTPSNDEVIEVSNSFHHQQQQQYYPQHRSSNKKNNRKKKNKSTTKKCAATLENVDYDADTIRREFKTYQHVLPDPDTLLQQHHSFHMIRTLIEKDHQLPVPRFLRYKFEMGHVKPHHALCCLLLTEYQEGLVAVSEAEGEAEAVAQQQVRNNDNDNDDDDTDPEKGEVERLTRRQYSTTTTCSSRSMSYWFVRMISLGYVYPQLDNPAEFIRDQFNRVAEVVPVLVVKAHELRNKIRNSGLPVPPYFLDPENSNQFPPHIALLVILQDDQQESEKFHSVCYRILFSLFAFVALLLRVVLEVIGGAGAIWGGGEVLKLRHGENAEVWRWFSITVGLLCLFRFITLNMPRQEDDGDILGPAGPWSLRFPVRIRAVAEHPFHYFFRAVPPFQYHNHNNNNNNNTTNTNPKKKD